MFFLASHGKSKFRDFFRFGVDLGCLLEGKIGEKLDFVHAFFDVVFSCVFGFIFYCFAKAVNLKNVALAQAKHQFLQNRRFRKRLEKSMKLGALLEPKFQENQ